MNDSQSLTRVVVLGRDIALWLCVNAISRALRPAGVHVVAIELPTRLQPSHVSATHPPLEALHAKLEIEESAVLRATGGSYSRGQNFVSGAGPGFFHAWGHYGYHLHTLPYAKFLESTAMRLGAQSHQAQTVTVERGTSTGEIVALIVNGSLRVEGQLFVDATGEEALLIGRSLGVPREDWREYFSVDRVLSARAPTFTSTPPFAEIRVGLTGWTALHPNRVMTGVQHAYSSHLLSDEAALESATAAAGAKLLDVSCCAVDPYIRSRVWEGNCIALSGAACALDPIHDVELHVLQLGLVHLLSLFPVNGRFAAERAEYNRLIRSCYERVRDFQSAFYALAPYPGELWQRLRPRVCSAALEHKIATFRARAVIAPLEDESFSPDSWQALFTGLGVVPESWPHNSNLDRTCRSSA